MIDVGRFFEDLALGLESPLPSSKPRELGDSLDDPAFLAEMKRYARCINDADVLAAFLGTLRRIRRRLEELRDRRLFQKDVAVQLGVVGGVGVIGASIVAAATAALPLIAIVPVGGALWMAALGYVSASRLDEERHIYGQLSELMRAAIEGLR